MCTADLLFTHSHHEPVNVRHDSGGIDAVPRHVSPSVQDAVFPSDLNARLVASVIADRGAAADDVVLSGSPADCNSLVP